MKFMCHFVSHDLPIIFLKIYISYVCSVQFQLILALCLAVFNNKMKKKEEKHQTDLQYT